MIKNITTLFLLLSSVLFAQIYPDQFYVQRTDSIYANIESSDGVKLGSDGKSIMLKDSVNEGYFILKPQTSAEPFNRGLPSWNGSSPYSNAGFKVQMRFPYGSGWSSWLTVGFWKEYIWNSYGLTGYGDINIDYDNVVMTTYRSKWQYKVIFTRTDNNIESPTINKLSFFVSDSRTTDNINYTQILNDKPPAIFIPTGFIYQYGVDPQIGGSICSPTSVAMILKSYNIIVNPYQFALDNYDPYFAMFGIWPRAVQNAAEHGLDGAVTRYRTWSEARAVLANGGRIAMSIGLPLYAGHLVMLAGFTSDGRPIVHDPAKSNGYSYIHNKSDLSHSWFDKGGVAYTFYHPDSVAVGVDDQYANLPVNDFNLYQNYPNPFNPSTNIMFSIASQQFVSLKVYDMLGNEVKVLLDEEMSAGSYIINFDGSELASGVYLYKLIAGNRTDTKKMLLMK
ncbi:MAG: T9SS type A sorting domain-containing protein [Ignavibacterium sp.]|jgi:hypothetical protein|nr:T9SS type A sorting domain-containing protein [Ignavibacterium sp.]MDX9712649.1 T9SS type A sorting domain-containing protein [Ignavibacteriaceae bacterium]MEB2354149.1 T9SS type A sorting domain-containing protein [Ignavibacteriales bacterium]GIK23066.1 MAG: hypothetical protein BroJett005_24800 [Ignavibacteriota bacterium]